MTTASSTVQQVICKTNSWQGYNQIISGTILWIITMITGASVTLAEPSIADLDNVAGRGIFCLEHLEKTTELEQPLSIPKIGSNGTAFIIEHNDQAFLVTARHVVEVPYDLRARVPAKHKDSGATEVIKLFISRASWIFHEQGPREVQEGATTIHIRAVDVAVSPIDWPSTPSQ